MTKLSIFLGEGGPADFITASPQTVEAARVVLGPEVSHLVPAHDLARALIGTPGADPLVSQLLDCEEPHVVCAVFD